MPRFLRSSLIVLGGLAATVLLGLGGVIAFDAPKPVPRLAAGDSVPGIERWDWSKLPSVSRVTARDGAPLTYRLYPGRTDRAVVLVHGSSGAGNSMHRLALELQSAGATVYAISLRGHGGSGTTNGDISCKGQLDDDLVDLVKAVGLERPGVHRTLIGFSSGGGFVLRQASGANRALFDAYLPLSPFIAQESPTNRPNAGGWASVAVPRVIALSVLDGFGLPLFQGLPVIRFATDSGPSDTRTPVYSFRLLAGLHLHRNWREEIARVDRPTAVMVGGNDELFRAEAFAPLFKELNPRIAVVVQPAAGHMSMIADDKAVAAVAAEWRRLAGVERADRFDMKVREEFFSGLDGDKEAFERAMTLIARTLESNPDHAEALVWRGDARVFLAGGAFQRGDFAKGMELSAQGLADMNRAVELMPNSVAVLVPRATGLMPFAKGMRPYDRAQADRLTRLALSDFEAVLRINAPRWSTLAAHDRGEVLGALADGWLQLGEETRANVYLDRMASELPGTPYATNAALRRKEPAGKAPLTCLGCH